MYIELKPAPKSEILFKPNLYPKPENKCSMRLVKPLSQVIWSSPYKVFKLFELGLIIVESNSNILWTERAIDYCRIESKYFMSRTRIADKQPDSFTPITEFEQASTNLDSFVMTPHSFDAHGMLSLFMGRTIVKPEDLLG